ncbi:MAG: amino acid ABC transporter permease [Symbiobacteriaceae bacterium]|nr:amino acid ABC transporter permease [Symbiobacteriaceae bacterium]
MAKIFDVNFLYSSFFIILQALPTTLGITLVAFAFGMLIGFFSAIVRIYRVPVLRHIVTFYTSFIRGTPLLVQIYLAYYGLPLMLKGVEANYGWRLDISGIPAIYYVYVAYAINTGAYLTETIRGAIEAVDMGQFEAAQSIGMTTQQMYIRIILPQAFLVALPNLGNTIISLIKDTSLAFSVTVVELIAKAKITAARNLRFFEVYIAAAAIYWLTCMVLEYMVKVAEQYAKKKRGLA